MDAFSATPFSGIKTKDSRFIYRSPRPRSSDRSWSQQRSISSSINFLLKNKHERADSPSRPCLLADQGSERRHALVALDDVTEETGSMEFVKAPISGASAITQSPSSIPPNTTRRNRLSRISTIDATNSSSSTSTTNQATARCTTGCSCMQRAAMGSTTQRRRATSRWAGDEVVYDPRPNIQRYCRSPRSMPGHRSTVICGRGGRRTKLR